MADKNIMTEQEKMIYGKMYDSSDALLLEQRKNAHKLCADYNKLYEDEEKERNEIFDKLVPNKGKSCYLQGPIQFDYGIYTTMGKGVYANFNLTVLDCAPVTIGDNVFFGPNCSLVTPMHPYLPKDATPESKKMVPSTH